MKNKFLVCRDRNGRTCLNVGQVDVTDKSKIGYIPMAGEEGFVVETTSDDSFYQRYEIMPKYPIDKACKLYLNYAVLLGASEEVLDYLSEIITITKEERQMAKSLFSNPPPKGVKKKVPAKKVPAKKVPAKKKPVVKQPAKKGAISKAKIKAAVKKVSKARKSSDVEYKSAAPMFQGLIMEGKLTDDEIFAQVQEAFSLDDKKRSYVSWYRNNLRKKGENPPEAL